jgi:hypothetical protein
MDKKKIGPNLVLGWGGEKRARPGPIGIDRKQLLRTDSGRQRCFKLFGLVALPDRDAIAARPCQLKRMVQVKVLTSTGEKMLFFLFAQLFQLFSQLLHFLPEVRNVAIFLLANDFENLIEL